MHRLAKRLEKRGWEKEEIAKALGIINNAKKTKTSENLFLEKRMYWILLAIIVTANFAISIALIPILMALKGAFLYFVIVVLGIVFGLLFELVIRSIEHLKDKHHLILAVAIPAVALINLFVISKISNRFESAFGIKNVHNPLIVALVYSFSFILPYIVYRHILKIEYYSEA